MNYNTAVGAKGICPPGWHVPTQQDWDNIENLYLGPGIAGSALKDIFSSNGFRGILTGIFYLNNTWKFTNGNLTGSMFWSSTSTLSGSGLAFGLNSINSSISVYPSSPGNAFPARCVKD